MLNRAVADIGYQVQVAIMKEVGASKRLGHLIEGESLLNDGSAYGATHLHATESWPVAVSCRQMSGWYPVAS